MGSKFTPGTPTKVRNKRMLVCNFMLFDNQGMTFLSNWLKHLQLVSSTTGACRELRPHLSHVKPFRCKHSLKRMQDDCQCVHDEVLYISSRLHQLSRAVTHSWTAVMLITYVNIAFIGSTYLYMDHPSTWIFWVSKQFYSLFVIKWC